MSNISQLIKFIDQSDFTPYNKVDDLVKQIDKDWKIETAHCQLRKVKPNRRVYKYSNKKPSSGNPVIGYKLFKADFVPINTLNLINSLNENLNEDLKELLKNIELSFDNLNKVKEINSAIKSNNDYYKKEVIKKYFKKV